MQKKRILALVLAGIMALSNFSVAFGVVKFDDVKADYSEAVGVLSSLKIIDGYEDGTFRPEKTITRAELAKVLVQALGYGELVKGAKSNFSDTQTHWADGYISIASGTGLIKGDGNGKFRPDDVVSYDEAFTMIVRALGYTDASLKGTWPTNFKIKATELDITDGVKMSTTGADRGGVAQAIFNSLEAATVKVDSDNNIKYEYNTDGKTAKTLLDKLCVLDEDYVVSVDTLDEDSKIYGGDLVDLTPYLYQSIQAYVDKSDKDEVIYVKDVNSIVVEGTIDMKADNSTVLNVKNADGKTVKVALNDDVKVFYNGAESTGYDMADLEALNDAIEFEKLVIVGKDSNDNDRIDKDTEVEGIIIDQQTKAAVVDSVYKSGRVKFDVFNLPTDDNGKVDLTKVEVTGAVDDISDIKVGDVVVAYEGFNTDAVKLVVSRDTIEGKVKRLSVSDNEVYINSQAKKVNTLSNEVYNSSTDAVRLTLGTEGTFFLDHNGNIVGYEGTTTIRGNYGVVIATAPGLLKNGAFDWEVVDLPAIKIAKADGKVEIFEVYFEVDEDDGTVSKSAQYDTTNDVDELDLLTTTGTAINFADASLADLAKGQLVKYNVNKDGEIDAITLVDEDTLTAVRTDSKGFVLASGAVIFENDNDKFPVIRKDYLDNSINGFGVYNENGELEVLLVDSADVDGIADDTVIAYLDKASDVARGYNEATDAKIVQIPTLFVNGEAKEYYCKDDKVFSGANAAVSGGVYELELDENGVIVKVTKKSLTSAEVVSVNKKGNMINLEIASVTDWYAVGDEATLVEVNGTTVDALDVFDLDETDTVKVIIVDEEIRFLIITR